MQSSLKLGRIRGIEIGVHYTWLIVFGLLTYSLAAGFLPSLYPGWSTAAYWVIGAIASLLLFVSVLAHELGHSFTAQSKGIPVPSITLFIFGGVSTISQESSSAGDEFQIAIAGPLVSLVTGIVSLIISFLVGGANDYISAIFLYLGYANLLLFVFNLIPGFPLDGGRVLRAIIWGVSRSMAKATKIASTVGVVIGFLFIAGGIFVAFSNLISGLWLIAIGWFLHHAAGQAYDQFKLEQSLSGVRVDSLMDPNPIVVEPSVSLAAVVDDYVLARNARGLPVVEDNRLIGIITLTDIRESPRDDWAHLTVRDRMTPRHALVVTTPDAPLSTALQEMAEREIHQIPVVRDDQLVGLLTRNTVIRFIQLRQELHQPAQVVARRVQDRSSHSEPGDLPERRRERERAG